MKMTFPSPCLSIQDEEVIEEKIRDEDEKDVPLR